MPSWLKWLADMLVPPFLYCTLWLAIGARWKRASCQLVPSPRDAGSANAGSAMSPAAARLSFINVAYCSAFRRAMYFTGSCIPTYMSYDNVAGALAVPFLVVMMTTPFPPLAP